MEGTYKRTTEGCGAYPRLHDKGHHSEAHGFNYKTPSPTMMAYYNTFSPSIQKLWELLQFSCKGRGRVPSTALLRRGVNYYNSRGNLRDSLPLLLLMARLHDTCHYVAQGKSALQSKGPCNYTDYNDDSQTTTTGTMTMVTTTCHRVCV